MGWDGIIPPFTKKIEMAAHYVDKVRKIQPHGPYYLGGYSFGGKVAVYMANILKAQGENVGLLALFDTYPETAREYVSLPRWLEQHDACSGARKIGGVLG